jgi:Helix-turn-helix domain/RodZ C-terminal domain
MHATETEAGIGRALRKARLRRGKSLEEASRETRVKPEYLQALEAESFDVLLGDVYVRGFLRSYSRYLGLSPEKVVSAYERVYGRARSLAISVHPAAGIESTVDHPDTRRRTAWILAAGAALIVLISAAAIGLISRSASTPTPAAGSPPAVAAGQSEVQVDMFAEVPGAATVTVDGEVKFNGLLDVGEAHSFTGTKGIDVHLDSGNTVSLRVNGTDLETPGLPGHEYDRTFVPSDFRSRESAPAG